MTYETWKIFFNIHKSWQQLIIMIFSQIKPFILCQLIDSHFIDPYFIESQLIESHLIDL